MTIDTTEIQRRLQALLIANRELLAALSSLEKAVANMRDPQSTAEVALQIQTSVDIAAFIHSELSAGDGAMVHISTTGELHDAVWLLKGLIQISDPDPVSAACHAGVKTITLPVWLAKQKGLI